MGCREREKERERGKGRGREREGEESEREGGPEGEKKRVWGEGKEKERDRVNQCMLLLVSLYFSGLILMYMYTIKQLVLARHAITMATYYQIIDADKWINSRLSSPVKSTAPTHI